MAEITTAEIKEFLKKIQGRVITLKDIRDEFNILRGTKSFDTVRNIMYQLIDQNIVKPTGRNDGSYKVIVQVSPVKVFGVQRQRREPFNLIFPKDFNTGMEMDFAERIILREGDLILITGVSNYGKTTMAMNFCGENIDLCPVLMGNEYTTPDCEPTPRFLNRLDAMGWVEWANGTGEDKFTLLPVREDYAEHIVKDRINIIDWINLDANMLYEISSVMDGIKKQIGKGIAIVCLQKGEGAGAGRGGQFTKDFTDCELSLDKLGEHETLLTIGKIKEYTGNVIGKTYGFSITSGVKIGDFREVKKCPACKGSGYKAGVKCDNCLGKKFIDKEP